MSDTGSLKLAEDPTPFENEAAPLPARVLTTGPLGASATARTRFPVNSATYNVALSRLSATPHGALSSA